MMRGAVYTAKGQLGKVSQYCQKQEALATNNYQTYRQNYSTTKKVDLVMGVIIMNCLLVISARITGPPNVLMINWVPS